MYIFIYIFIDTQLSADLVAFNIDSQVTPLQDGIAHYAGQFKTKIIIIVIRKIMHKLE